MGHETEPNFSALANELVVHIASFARLRDVLSLRLTSRKMAGNCSRAIKQRNLTLYLHPLRVQDAIDVCHLDLFRNSINEVILLGKSTQTLRPDDFSEGFDNYHPWPLCEDMSGLDRFHLDDPSAYSEDHHRRKWMPTCYASLFDALNRLPNLNTLSYASTSYREGLCLSSQGVIDAHRREADPWHTFIQDTLKVQEEYEYEYEYEVENENENDDGDLDEDQDQDEYGGEHDDEGEVENEVENEVEVEDEDPNCDFLRFWTDSELIMGLLAARCAPIITINLHQSMPDRPRVRWTRIHSRWSPKTYPVAATKRVHKLEILAHGQLNLDFLNDNDYRDATIGIGRGVTRLSLIMPDGDMKFEGYDGWGGLFHEFAVRMQDLEALDVRIDSAIDQHFQMLVSGTKDTDREQRFEKVQGIAFSTFFYYFCTSDFHFDCLQQLRLTSPSILPGCLDSDNVGRFLETHKATLRVVSFTNIFFAELQGGEERGIRDGMLEVIRAVSGIASLESASMYVPRLESVLAPGVHHDHAKCYRSSGEDWKSTWFTMAVFDELADQLQIPLEGTGWDFVKHVVPQKQMGASVEA